METDTKLLNIFQFSLFLSLYFEIYHAFAFLSANQQITLRDTKMFIITVVKFNTRPMPIDLILFAVEFSKII